MSKETLVLINQDGFSRTRQTSINENTPEAAGFIPILGPDGRIDNAILKDTLNTSRSLRWDQDGSALVISDGSVSNGPNGERITDNKNSSEPWEEGYPVLFGFKEGKTIGVRVDSSRNADTVAELEVGDTGNNEPNKVVRTDSNGNIHGDYLYLNGEVENTSADFKNFLYVSSEDNKVRKGKVSEINKVLHLDNYCYDLDLSSLDTNLAYPVKFAIPNIAMVITESEGNSFSLKIEAATANSDLSSPHTIACLNHFRRSYVSKIINTLESKSLIVYLIGGYIYRVYNLDRYDINRGEILCESGEEYTRLLPNKNWFITGDTDIIPETEETYIRTTHPSFLSTGWGNAEEYQGNSYKIARADHTHRYDVNSEWLEPFDDRANLKLFGKNKSMVFKTNGTTPYASEAGSYPFVWMYGGDKAQHRLMYLTTNGDLYPTRCYNAVYADLAECFVPKNSSLNMTLEYPGRIVEIADDGKIVLAQENSSKCIGVISNSYGFVLNGTQEEIDDGTKVPVAMCGTVWVEAETPAFGVIGNYVCSGRDGKAKVTFSRDYSVGKIIEIKENMYRILVSI